MTSLPRSSPMVSRGEVGGLSDQQNPLWQDGLQTLIGVALLAGYQLASPTIALASVAAFATLALLRPQIAICAVVFALPYTQEIRPAIGEWAFSAAEVGIVATTVVTLGRFMSTLRRRPSIARFGAVELLALGLVLLGALSLIASTELRESLRSFRLVIVEPVLLFGVAIGVGGREWARRYALALVGAAAVVALIGLWQYVVNANIITAEDGLRRIRAYYGSPNNLALFLGRAAPVAVAMALADWPRLPLVGASGIILVALALTFSVGGWLAAGVAVLAVLFLWNRRLGLIAIGAAVAFALLASPILLSVERFRTHLDFGSGTTFLRLKVWQSALDMIRDHPIAGIGLDNFLHYYGDLGYMLPEAWREPDLSHPHNLFLDFWLSLGLPGAIWIVVALVAFFVVALRLSSKDTADRAVVIGAIGAMIDFVAHGLIDNSFFLPDLAVIFWLGFAIVLLLWRSSSSPTHLGRTDA